MCRRTYRAACTAAATAAVALSFVCAQSAAEPARSHVRVTASVPAPGSVVWDAPSAGGPDKSLVWD
ncbi:hypothetical protein ACIQU1_11320 [Streptomyces angustmyceticus]|uniref:hypothetical protein n=1 Tax=Streptomyces angustmyceticus TaxID=285578 RepID=UPI00344F9809